MLIMENIYRVNPAAIQINHHQKTPQVMAMIHLVIISKTEANK